uniref:DNA-directed DNA polymerase n=1 Tax=Tanacetum cinerariifolium TaxID=118510 RepID=A0A6L2KD89_TANCI|nr:DNA-directed DNA polymerase [Tanacetum cinerariifolium]
MQEVIKKQIVKLLDTGIIYLIADSPWVSPIYCVPKKGCIIVVTNENDELVPTRTIMGWRVCIDYQKLNEATAKNHFPLPFMDQMLERLAGNKYLCFLDGFSGYFQIPVDPNDQEKTTFTCPFGTYAYRDAHLVLNLEKSHFMVKERIMLGHKVTSAGLEVDKAKVDVISKLPPPTNIKEIKDRKGTENIAADHLSQIRNNKSSDDSEVDDNFPRETLLEINTKDEPWRCVSGPETQTILDQCHHEPTCGHYGPNITAKKAPSLINGLVLLHTRNNMLQPHPRYDPRTKLWRKNKWMVDPTGLVYPRCSVSVSDGMSGLGLLDADNTCWMVTLNVSPSGYVTFRSCLIKMRIEQYFLMTDYSLWEVILNGDSPTPTRIVDGVVQAIAPTTAEQKLAKKNELKARGTLLMALPYKHQLKFNIHKDAKSLMEAIEKSLDDLFNNLKIYEAEVKSSSSTSQNTQNIAFVSSQNTNSTNESVSAVPSVSAASTKAPTSILPNVDNLSNAVIYSFFASQSNSPRLDNEDLKQIDADDLEEMDLKWQMVMLTMRARRFLQRTGRNLGANGTIAIGFDMSTVECYNCHRRGHFTRECRSPRDTKNKDTQRRIVPVETSTSNALCDGVGSYDWSIQADEEPINFTIMAFTSSSSSSSSVFDCDELNSFESDKCMPTSPVHGRYKPGEGYHVVPPSYTRTFMPLKPDLVFHNAPTASETVFNVKPSTTKPTQEMSQSNRPSAPIIEDWIVDSEDESEVEHPTQAENLRKDIPKSKGHKLNWTRKACFVCKSLNHLIKDCDYYEKQMVQKPVWNYAMRVNHQNSARMTNPYSTRHVVPTAVLTKSRLVPLNVARPVTTVGNPHQALKDKGVIDSGCSRHITGNISYLSDFEKINGGYVAFGGNPKSGYLTCLFAKATLDESNLWHTRLGHINFKTMNKLVKGNLVRGLPSKVFRNNHTCVACKKGKLHRASCKSKPVSSVSQPLQRVLVTKPHNKTPYELLLGRTPSIGFMRPFGCPVTILNTLDPLGKFDGKADEGFLVGYSVNSKDFKVFNSRTRIFQETLHINFLENQPNITGSGPKWLFDIDTLTQSMNYQPLVARNQPNLSAGIKENLDADADVAFDVDNAKREAKGKSHVDLSTGVMDLRDKFKEFSVNNTNRVNAASAPFTAVGPNLTNSTNNMPALEDIVYSDDEEDVGAEADFSNLETTPQTRSMARMEEPKRIHQVLKDPSWIEAIQDELLQFKMQKKKGIDYEEVFAPVARIEVIWLFLAYASSMGFMVYQMDVKSAFLYGTIEEEVYVCQPLGFEDPDYLDKVYKVVKALYGLHQAPRAWLRQSKMSFRQALDLIFKLDEAVVRCTRDILRQRNCLDQLSEILWVVTTFIVIEGEDIVAKFCSPSRWKELSKEMSSMISHVVMDSTGRHGVGSKRYHVVLYEELNGILVALVASDTGPSNTVVSLTLGKSSNVDPSQYPDDPNMSTLEEITYSDDEEDVGAEANFSKLETNITVSPILTTRVHKDHPVTQIIGDLSSTSQTRSMTRMVNEQGGLTQINNEDFHTCMFVCSLSQEESNREEGIDYEEVFAPVVRIEAIRLFLAYASFIGFMVYQMDVKSAFLYGTIEEEEVCLTDEKSASTPIDNKKPLLKDPDGKDLDVHTNRYLKGKPHLGFWYPKDSPFNLVAYLDSDYAGASLDRKSTTGGCQFLGCRLISWQCKKQTVVSTSSTKAEYIAAASCCAQVLWIQN